MNNILAQLNSVPMYAICGGIIAFVAVVCVIFLVRSYRAGLAIGIDPARMKRAITSSATFSVLPSVGILLGVIALSGSLGTPWPWRRCSSSARCTMRRRSRRLRPSRSACTPCPPPR